MENYEEMIHAKAQEVLGYMYNKSRIAIQIKKILYEPNRTLKGVYEALLYWYDVQDNDPAKAQGGITIVSYIYDDAQRYWREREQNNKRNTGKVIADFLPEESVDFTFVPKPIVRPKGVTLFDIY